LATSVACSNGKDNDTDDTTPVETETEETETAPTGSTLVDLEAMSLSAEFGYDLATDMTIEGNYNGNTFLPTITFQFGSEDFFTSGDDDEGCAVFAVSSGLSGRASWVAGEMIFGFEMQAPFTVDSSACEGILDPADVDALVGQFTATNFLWGLAAQENLGSDAATALAQADIEAIGGGYAGSWNATDEITEITEAEYDADGGYLYAIAIDETGALQDDGSAFTNLTVDEMVVDGVLQRGYYILGSVFYYTFN
jgi:hypothetical protein